ncbi:hypothetical protein ACF3VQ_09940 [Yersinia sp. HM-2024]|uniref:hypothetical protein n=1 Tax=Yersinia sp. HM-2024 TaxID=3344550 RepID=UPI00370D4BCB
MTIAKISSGLQQRISLYQKSAQNGHDKQKMGIEGFSQKFVRITQSPVERKLSRLQGQHSPVEKHSSISSHIPVSQNIVLKQQNTSNKPTGSLANISPKDLIQELKEKLSAVKNNTGNVTHGGPHKGLSVIQQEIVQAKEKDRLEEPNRVAAEAKADARIAKALANELAQQAGNKTNAQTEPAQVKLQFDANGIPTSAPPMPAPSFLTPSRSIELKPQDKSKQQTGTSTDKLVKDLIQELTAKLAKAPNQSGDVTNVSPQKQLSAVQQEIARARAEYKIEEPNRVAAEAKADARIAEALANELAQQAGYKTPTEAEQCKVDLKFDANGVPTSTPPLPSF